MANLTLAPEEDDPGSPFHLNLRLSARKSADQPPLPSEVQSLLRRFDPKKVGFGLLAPWPGTDQALPGKESLAGSDLSKRDLLGLVWNEEHPHGNGENQSQGSNDEKESK